MLFLLRIIILSSMLCFFQGNTYASTGQVNIIPSPPTVVAPNTAFNITGNYVLLIDTVPSNASRDCGFYSIAPPVFSPSYWDWIFWSGEHATLHYSIDGVDRGQIGLVGYSRGINPSSDLGKTLNFSVPINTSGMQPGSVHTASVFIQDTYAAGCYYVGWYLSWGRAIGPVIAIATHQFTIANPTPKISINLGKPSLTPCDTETGKITVTSNDPTPNGGTVTLTFPNGTTASAAFTGKTATLTFADFGLPNGYSGASTPGSTLNFTASVTTAAGYTANATATANVIAGGLTITMTPDTATLEPKLQNRKAIEPAQLLGARTQGIQIKVVGPLGPVQGGTGPLQGAIVTAVVEMFPGAETFGGHDHGVTSRPLWTLGSLSPVKEVGNGIYSTTYSSSIYASKAQIRVTASHPSLQCTGKHISQPFIAKVANLQPVNGIVLTGNNRLVGGTCNHHGPSDNTYAKVPASCRTPDHNHYLRATSLSKLNKLQQAWAKAYANIPTSGIGYLRINDASLPEGGKFEAYNSNLWTQSVTSGHKTHDRGTDVDIGHFDTNWQVTVTEKKLRKLNKEYDYTLFRGLFKEKTHTHVYLE